MRWFRGVKRQDCKSQESRQQEPGWQESRQQDGKRLEAKQQEPGTKTARWQEAKGRRQDSKSQDGKSQALDNTGERQLDVNDDLIQLAAAGGWRFHAASRNRLAGQMSTATVAR